MSVAKCKRSRRFLDFFRSLLVVSVAASFLNCIDSGDAQRKEAADQAKFELELQLARTDVAEKAYAEGRLGAPEKVRADIEQSVQYAIGAGAEGDPQFLTSDGRLIPFRNQSHSQQMAFLNWITGPEVIAVVGPEMVAARDAVRKRWKQPESRQ